MNMDYQTIDQGYAAFIDGDKIGELHRDVERGWGWLVKIDGMKTVFRSTLPQAKNAIGKRAISTA